MGHCTAGGAYTPAMSDEVVIVKGHGAIFLGGPPLVRMLLREAAAARGVTVFAVAQVKAATGEVVDAESLGGADLHCSTSGVADHFAHDDTHAMALVRDIVSTLNVPSTGVQKQPSAEPVMDSSELDMLAGMAMCTGLPVPAHELVGRLVDGSEFKEFKARFGSGLCTGEARLVLLLFHLCLTQYYV